MCHSVDLCSEKNPCEFRVQKRKNMISVVIPLYNKESIVEQSLRSVLSQSFRDFEVIVVDDGSTDRSAEIVRDINDPRIRLVSQANGGPSKARNTGIREAKGEWILFLDADDELLPNALHHFHELISKYKDANLIACPFYVRSEEKTELLFPCGEGRLNDAFKAHALHLFLPRTGACIYTRELVLSCLFDERLRRYEDFEQLFRMYRKARVIVSSTPVLVCNVQYVAASHARNHVEEDFCNYLNFKGKNFWETMCLYNLFIGERDYYPTQFRRLYPSLYHRLDLFSIYKFHNWIRRCRPLWNLYLNMIGCKLFTSFPQHNISI